MVDRSSSGRWQPSAWLVAGLAFVALSVHAGTVSVENVIANFQFEGANVDYNPDPDKVFVTFDNPQVTLSTADNSAAPETYRSANGLQSALFLDSSSLGDLLRVSFNTFGSLPPVEGASPVDLIQGSALAMGGKNLQFIVDTAPVPGSLASRFRDARVYTTVAGLSLEDWLRPYSDPQVVKFDFLAAASEVAGDVLTPATPIPTTLLLFLAAGIPLVLMRRRG